MTRMAAADLPGAAAAPDARPLIAFAIPELDSGGPDRVLFELLSHLPRDRFRLALIVGRAGGRYFDALPADVTVKAIGGGRYPVWRLARAVDALVPAILFTTLRMNLTAGFALPLMRRRPVVVMRQANALATDFAILKRKSLLKHRIAERATHNALRAADAVVAQSGDMARELAGLLRPGQRLETIGNPFDIAATRALADAQSKTAPALPGAPKLLSVGRLMPQKGYDLLIEAMPAILARQPQAQLTIAGEGDARDALKARIAALGLGGAVHLPGRSDVPLALMRQADLFVSSSRYEGFSNVLAEAIAVGCPVAATDCFGATSELIEDGATGWLAPAEPAAIADAVLRALSGDREAAATRAAEHLDSRFSRAGIVACYAGFLAALAAPDVQRRNG